MATINSNTERELDQDLMKAVRDEYSVYLREEIIERQMYTTTNIDAVDFHNHALFNEDLFAQLNDVASRWGTDNYNYDLLKDVFIAYAASKPQDVQKTFNMFASLFELVAKVIEHRNLINWQLRHYSDVVMYTEPEGTIREVFPEQDL